MIEAFGGKYIYGICCVGSGRKAIVMNEPAWDSILSYQDLAPWNANQLV